MILSFHDRTTERLFHGEPVPGVSRDVSAVAYRKLIQLHTVTRLHDLRIPPGNRLKALQGRRAGTFSLRVNRQWRITFRWHDGAAHDVLFEDYH